MCLYVLYAVVVIVDPGIPCDETCQSYADGKKLDIFIKVQRYRIVGNFDLNL